MRPVPAREYPDAPRVGVGAVVLDGGRVLLVRRGNAPSQGKWSLPGGLIDLGETLESAVVREVEEECGLRVRVLGLCGVIDRIVPGEPAEPGGAAPVRYHWVIVDYVAAVIGGTLQAGTDAAEARWVPVAEIDRHETTEGLASMIHRAVSLQQAFVRHAKA
jgi:ADP-ribose pyrophosphatase YjhB (NUDIX family)